MRLRSTWSAALCCLLILPAFAAENAATSPAAAVTYRDPILNPDGTLNWTKWAQVAANYHNATGLAYRLGPSFTDLNGTAPVSFPTIYQPDPQGLWRGGDAQLANAVCQTSDKLPRSEAEEKAIADYVGNFQMSGQMLFLPDPGTLEYYTAGSANTRTFDSALGLKTDAQGNQRHGLCLRIRVGWFNDWWNRNNISNPTTPAVRRLREADPKLPVPPIATARGGIQASVTGFLAFQNGVIAAAGTGNDPYCNGFESGIECEPSMKLPEGKVPTALALTAMNEFLFATVWDVKAKKGQLAVIAIGPTNPANIGKQELDTSYAGRDGWGAQSWPTIKQMKLLGFVDLPMSAPSSLSVAISSGTQKFRGYEGWHEDLRQQSVRDAWYNRAWNDGDLNTQWKQLASAGYAVVASRAENRVAFVDLRPLLNYYRKMYLTTQANFDQTADNRQGPGPYLWPYTFDSVPEQKPTIASVISVPQPTAVHSPQRMNGTDSLSGWDGLDWNYRYTQAWVASMDGTVRVYDVTSLGDPTKTPVGPKTPKFTVKVGPNPVQLTSPISNTLPNDDIFVVSRGSREVTCIQYNGKVKAILKDDRLKDPVFLTIGGDGAGFGGSGAGKALGARVLSILDYNGKTVHAYGMYTENYPQRYNPDRPIDPPFQEQWPFLGPDGKVQQFQYGYGEPLPGKPFMWSFDEVI